MGGGQRQADRAQRTTVKRRRRRPARPNDACSPAPASTSSGHVVSIRTERRRHGGGVGRTHCRQHQSLLRVLTVWTGAEVGDVAPGRRSASDSTAVAADRYGTLRQQPDDGGRWTARQQHPSRLKILAARRTGHGAGRIFPYGPVLDPPPSRTLHHPGQGPSAKEACKRAPFPCRFVLSETRPIFSIP